jgi:hypothetical protein
MKLSILILLICISSLAHAQQNPCKKGDDAGKPGCPDPNGNCPPSKDGKGFSIFSIPVIRAADPNEIIGPAGYDSIKKWVSSKANMAFKILFENDPEFATAPAQRVTIYMPIPEKLNPNALRISDFGFGSFNFVVPANTTIYSKRLDVRDSLGVFVDVTAGLDVANRRAFWVFESIDPATNLAATLAAYAGFLPVNDSIFRRGEGYVTFSLQPISNSQTKDTAACIASIIFDTEDTIKTNTWVNTIDAVAPQSKVINLPSQVDSVFTVNWQGSDDIFGTGIKYYDLYVSKNNGPFSLYESAIDSTNIRFTGDKGASYGFYTIATDNTGNREAAKTVAELTATVKGNGIPIYVRALLQGAYIGTGTNMHDSLRKQNILPQTEPYRSLSYTAVNNSNIEAARAGLFDSTGSKAITDWVWLELRNAANPLTVVATRSALIRTDGLVTDIDGESPVFFNNVINGNYYVVIKHRNHLGAMTGSAIALNSVSNSIIDFTNTATPTYGTNAQLVFNGTRQLWAGDINRDGIIRYNGAANDRNMLLNVVGLVNPNVIINGYNIADVNMDGKVKYNGAANDKNFILANIGIATPNNTVIEQLPR